MAATLRAFGEDCQLWRSYWLQLVSRYFEPSQPQRMTSRLKTMFSPSPIYSARQVIKAQIIQNHKIYQNITCTNIEHKIFEKLFPSVSPLLKKHIIMIMIIIDHFYIALFSN